MNEEQAVLNFFAQKENLPLALSVANQVDGTRRKLNHDFWLALSERIVAYAPGWRASTTEDRNATECLVGLYLQPEAEQKLYLCPLLEQQYLGDTLRIYYGLMWSATPTLEQKQLSAINTLRHTFQEAGFKSNDRFLAWQWTSYYPRDMDFLLRFSTAADSLLNEAASLIQNLLMTHREALHLANTTLRQSSRNAAISAISLDKLRANLER
ncbi:conserved hypothetical protein [Candidatus Nitrotoga sp. BS]|uniref:hypothetical protein n=1 Tax=Candidatus Nitrotoga sp. BS TaxID=2890408 RepID=UPI001EF3B632|nr:hypothetical protein [Candidatus Nitrotoga sp. BS]CAH1199433.1 conserved hypothetical protein [Candidatus Nitrotoga sp. BS]